MAGEALDGAVKDYEVMLWGVPVRVGTRLRVKGSSKHPGFHGGLWGRYDTRTWVVTHLSPVPSNPTDAYISLGLNQWATKDCALVSELNAAHPEAKAKVRPQTKSIRTYGPIRYGNTRWAHRQYDSTTRTFSPAVPEIVDYHWVGKEPWEAMHEPTKWRGPRRAKRGKRAPYGTYSEDG